MMMIIIIMIVWTYDVYMAATCDGV